MGIFKHPLSEEKRFQLAKQMYDNQKIPVGDICHSLHIPRSTFYKYMRGS
jgi:Helix-turn-helix domain of resolvase